MNEMIVIGKHEFSGCQKQTVNARELHAFLGVQSKFADWIKNRIDEYGFVENQDYITFSKNLENGGRTKEYALTLDMAKELSMVERTDKGKQARQYFIECERRAQSAPAIPQTLPDALRLAADLAEQNQQQQARLAIAEPKAAALDLIAIADGNQTVTNAAKLLKTSPKKLFDWLSQNRWLYKRNGKGAWIGYQDKVQSGYLTHGEYRYTRSSGEQELTVQVYLTPKGIAKIAAVLAAEGVAA